MTKFNFNPKLPLGRICLDLLLPSCFLTALVRLPASALPFHLDVARHAFDETSAHLLNNRTKSVKDSNDRFGIICPSMANLLSFVGRLQRFVNAVRDKLRPYDTFE